MRRTTLVMLALAVTAALAGCGVPIEDNPRAINKTPPPSQPSSAPTPVESGPVEETLVMVKDGRLFEVERRMPAVTSVKDLIDHLFEGPTAEERDGGITSALLGSNIEVVSIGVVDGEAIVELAGGVEGSGRTDDVYAYAQIVCTLGNRPGISKVSFTQGGKRLAVPRGDAVVAQEPLTPDDYAELFQASSSPQPTPTAR